MIYGEQMRAALAALRWSRRELSEKTGLSPKTIQRLVEVEGLPNTSAKNLEVIEKVFKEGNSEYSIEFTADNGVIMNIKKPRY